MRFEPLTPDGVLAVEDAALRILEDVGLRLDPASRAAQRLRGEGLRVGADGCLRLPRAAVAEALARAPRVVRLGARDPRLTAVLDGARTYVTTDGCGSRTIDLETRARRPSALEDIARSARLTDALDGFGVYWMMVSAQDVPVEIRVPTEFLTAVRNTTKHVQMIDAARPEEAGALVRMARVLGDDGVTTDPPVSMLISVVSPLRLDPGGLNAALVFAEAGLPVVACSMPISSVTAPATPAGLVALAHAEILGFAAVLQTLHPGAPVVYCSFPAFADARTGITNYLDPRRFWAAAAATVLGHRAGLPAFTSGELGSLLMRPDLLCFGGLLEVSTLLSFEQLIIDHEMLRDWAIAAAPQATDAEALAFEAIRDVGPGGHYLTHRHTARHIREFVVPKFTAPDRPVEPAAGSAPAAGGRETALREARRLLGTHAVEPLPAATDATLERQTRDAVFAA